MTIKFKLTGGSAPIVKENGDWFDLAVAESCEIKANECKLVSLGISIALPRGFEAHVLPRSSLFLKKGILLGNSQGIIDNSYCGNTDIWKFCAVAFRDTKLTRGEAICQFRIVLSQRAGILAKLRWLFMKKIVFKEVNSLDSSNRGGFGSTGGYIK